MFDYRDTYSMGYEKYYNMINVKNVMEKAIQKRKQLGNNYFSFL